MLFKHISLGVDHLIFEGGGGVGRIEKKISCRAVTTEKEIMQHRWPRKKMPTQIARQKKFRTIPGNALWKGCSPGNLGNYPAPFRE